MIHGNIDGFGDELMLEICPSDPLVPCSGVGEDDFFLRVRALSRVPAQLLDASASKLH